MIDMKKCLLLALTVFFISQSVHSAGYTTGKIKRYYNGGNDIFFGLEGQVDQNSICTYFQEHFRFDATTPEGKTMFATLMASKLADRPIAVWYQESTLPGTNHENGCNSNNMAVMTSIGLY